MKKILIVGYRGDWDEKAANAHKDVIFINGYFMPNKDQVETIIGLVEMVDGVVFLQENTAYEVAAIMLKKDIYEPEYFVKQEPKNISDGVMIE